MHGRAASRRLSRRNRAALVWGLVFFLAAQVGLLLALATDRALRDPEYGRRLVALRARLAERPAGRPVVAVLGSSRVAMGFRPGLLRTNEAAGTGPVVFNMAICRAGPVMELLTLRRLLADGVRPDLVLAEASPQLMVTSTGEEQLIAVGRLTWRDVRTLAPYYTDPAPLRSAWFARSRLPWSGERTHLLGQWAPEWLSTDKRENVEWKGLDGWGWLYNPVFDIDGIDNPVMQHARFAGTAQACAAASVGYQVTDLSRRACGEMAALCARRRIRFALIRMPDPFLNYYSPDADIRFDRELGQLGKELDVPVVDARDWVPREDFLEGVHPTPKGAAIFTARFERELGAELAGAPLCGRWPAGRVETPPLLHLGPGFGLEELWDGSPVHWCGKAGEATLVNTSDRPRLCRVRFLARRPLPGPPHRLAVRTPSASYQIGVDFAGQLFDQVIEVPPGKLTLQFDCTADVFHFGEGKDYAFVLVDPAVTEARSPTHPALTVPTSHPGPLPRHE